VRVGEIDPGPRDLDQDFALAGLGVRQVTVPEHLRPAELLDLDRFHENPSRFMPPPYWPGSAVAGRARPMIRNLPPGCR
jgi:hypothetical protein